MENIYQNGKVTKTSIDGWAHMHHYDWFNQFKDSQSFENHLKFFRKIVIQRCKLKIITLKKYVKHWVQILIWLSQYLQRNWEC